MVFERKILRRIYGPTKVRDGTWRIKSNEELNRLIGNKNIINYIKAQRLAWIGHVHRMPDDRMVKKICEWTPMSTSVNGHLCQQVWMDTYVNKITRKTQKQVGGWCNKHENKQLEGLHQKSTQMEGMCWVGQNFPEVVVPQEEEDYMEVGSLAKFVSHFSPNFFPR
jgi:hypothetical protein